MNTLVDLIMAIPAAVVCVLPGYFWARILWASNPDEGWTERITLSTALSLALVPATALALARLFDTSVTTAVAAASVLLVLATGIIAYAAFGPPKRSKVKRSEGKSSSEKPPSEKPPPEKPPSEKPPPEKPPPEKPPPEKPPPEKPPSEKPPSEKPPSDNFASQARSPAALGTASLLMVSLAFAVVLGANLILFPDFWNASTSCWGWGGSACDASGSVQRLMPFVALALLIAGAFHLYRSPRENPRPMESPSDGEAPFGWRRFLLPAVLLATVARNYSGVVLHDWPFIRGVDHYSHAVMANRMMFEGRIEPYFVYPSGFHLATANVSRLSGLDPLDIYSALGPLLPILPVIACYTLAKRLWGWQVGVGAAFFAGLAIGGPYYYLSDSMYPNLVGAQFLLVLTVAALVALYAAPTARAMLLVAFLGSSVVLFHQVSSLYLALLLAAVSLYILPYLLLRERRTGVVLFCSLASLSLISFFYAWDIYDLPGVIAASLGFTETGATGDAVSATIGTQSPFGLASLFGTVVSQPVSWLALLGAILAVGAALRSSWTLPQKLALLTLLLWALVIIAGSLTPLSGFPQRFGRDLGVPLTFFAAFALIAILRSLSMRMPEGRTPAVRSAAFYVAAASVLLVGGVTGLRVAQGVEQAGTSSWRMTTSEGISEAGAWLEENNDGGNIMVGPQRNQVPSRMMLAMGDYSALQSFTESNIAADRDLPPGGREAVEDVLRVIYDPSGTAHLLEKHDVRYIVHYKDMPDREIAQFWRAFDDYPNLYRTAFENSDVVIFEPRDSFADTG